MQQRLPTSLSELITRQPNDVGRMAISLGFRGLNPDAPDANILQEMSGPREKTP